ncbi:hypothetical protein D9M71_491860 [compost metagenome]
MAAQAIDATPYRYVTVKKLDPVCFVTSVMTTEQKRRGQAKKHRDNRKSASIRGKGLAKGKRNRLLFMHTVLITKPGPASDCPSI